MSETGAAATPISVGELTRRVKSLLETHFDWVLVEGEIGDFTAASSGHWYFTLKDSGSQVRVAMFRRANQQVKFNPRKGDLVRLRARVSLYESRGEFQLIGEHLQPAGDGELQLAFEQLKQRLLEEGLFAAERKREIPKTITRLGVITSETGAALQDILSVLARRSPLTQISVFPVPVQGDAAAPAIVRAIEHANRLAQQRTLSLECLIVGRGGGSLEDLWAFNDEALARTIAASRLPIVSAVGHETDFSIADFVADLRAATPSAAAELVSTDQTEWYQRIDHSSSRLNRALDRRLAGARQQLQQLRSQLKSPARRLVETQDKLRNVRKQLARAIDWRVDSLCQDQQQLKRRLVRCHPLSMIKIQADRLNQTNHRLAQKINERLSRAQIDLTNQIRLLESLSPRATLDRGYAIVHSADGRIIRSAVEAEAGDQLRIQVSDGDIAAEVLK
jgi:exodeoxyribonuclease VII large subunit